MRTSLRSEPVQQVNLFAFLDIVFTATGVLMVIGVFFSLSPHLEKISREPELPAETIARQKELQTAIATWRENESWEKRVRQLRAAPRPSAVPSATRNGAAAAAVADPATLLIDEEALAANNRPLTERINDLEEATLRRLAAASAAEKSWLQREQSLLEEQRRTRRLLLKVDRAPSLKEVVLVVVSGATIDVERLEQPEVRWRLEAPWSEAARAKLLAKFAPANQRFLLFFKPTGADYFAAMRATLKQAGFEVGSEPLPEAFSVGLHEHEAPFEPIR